MPEVLNLPASKAGRFWEKRAQGYLYKQLILRKKRALHFQFTSSYKSHVHIGLYIGGLGLGGGRCQVCGLLVWRQNEHTEKSNEATTVSETGITGFHPLSVGSDRADQPEGRKWCHTEILRRVPSNKFLF